MSTMREFRKALTFGTMRACITISKHASHPGVVEGIRYTLFGLGRVALPFRQHVVRNMKLTGVYRPGLYPDYLARAVDQYVMMAHVFRSGAESVQNRFVFDDSLSILTEAQAQGKGVIHIAPHICGYPAYAGSLDRHVPTAIYLRRNKDPRKMKLNEAAGVAGQGNLVYPPEGATKAQKLQVAIDVLRRGLTLFITPDNPRKPHRGFPVPILGRYVPVPLGAYLMSMRTGAPVIPVFWHWEDGAYRVRIEPPLALDRRKGIQQQMEQAAHRWAAMVDEFLHRHPEMFWSWPDKRWTQIIRRTGSFREAPGSADQMVIA